MHVQQALTHSLAEAGKRQAQMLLLLDTATAENSHLTLDRWQIPYWSLFEGTPEERLLEIAPLLIAVSGLEDDKRTELFGWVEKLAYAAPCLSWFFTDETPSQAAEHLRRFHVVGLSDQQAMLMRWYDTRILPVWLSCLTPSQAKVFAAHTSGWQYVDRFGETIVVPDTADRAEELPDAPFGAPWIQLNDAQYSVLVDAAELDTLTKHLRQVIRDELRHISDRALLPFVGKHQQEAIKAGLKDIDRQTQYVLLALYTSGAGVEHPAVKAALQPQPENVDVLSERLQALPDEVWSSGLPLWADGGSLKESAHV